MIVSKARGETTLFLVFLSSTVSDDMVVKTCLENIQRNRDLKIDMFKNQNGDSVLRLKIL